MTTICECSSSRYNTDPHWHLQQNMKLLNLIVISLSSILLLVPLLVVESSSTSDNLVSNITRGSSISTTSLNDTSPYWLSPSGNIAFGFYQLPWSPDRYVVGIWFVKSSQKTLVWTANPNDLPLHKPSSILLTEEGKLVLRIIPDNKDELLLSGVPEPASYAKMHDDGNFVLYGSDFQVVWESFDYPTDTILGGQKLRPGIDLISGDYRLSVKHTNGYVAIYYMTGLTEISVMSDALDDGSLSGPVILSLDITGKLYLATYYDDQVVKVFYQDKRKQQVMEEGDYMYRATLSSIGHFDLHKERIDHGNDNKSEKLSSNIVWPTYIKPLTVWEKLSLLGECFVLYGLMGVTLKLCCGVYIYSFEKDGTGGLCCGGAKVIPIETGSGDLELGRQAEG